MLAIKASTYKNLGGRGWGGNTHQPITREVCSIALNTASYPSYTETEDQEKKHLPPRSLFPDNSQLVRKKRAALPEPLAQEQGREPETCL